MESQHPVKLDIECDISIRNSLSRFKTRLLKMFICADDRVKPLILGKFFENLKKRATIIKSIATRMYKKLMFSIFVFD